jgi:hypothetical protein
MTRAGSGAGTRRKGRARGGVVGQGQRHHLPDKVKRGGIVGSWLGGSGSGKFVPPSLHLWLWVQVFADDALLGIRTHGTYTVPGEEVIKRGTSCAEGEEGGASRLATSTE